MERKGKGVRLGKKEEVFCQWYSLLGHPQEAAVAAGYGVDEAQSVGGQLLGRDEIAQRCQVLKKKHGSDAIIGLKRLAFSPINDAVKLVAGSELPTSAELAQMDLFAVSGLRLGKDGRMEATFYDRFRVLETLLAAQSEPPTDIYDAIARSAARVEDSGEDDER